jgi:hypothetical protein
VSYGGNDGSDLPLKQFKHALNSSPPKMKVNKKEAFCAQRMNGTKKQSSKGTVNSNKTSQKIFKLKQFWYRRCYITGYPRDARKHHGVSLINIQ